MAMFCWPVVLLPSAPPPIATLKLPVVLLPSAKPPTPVLLNPVLTASALNPSAVCPIELSQSLGQSTALSGGESANQVSTMAVGISTVVGLRRVSGFMRFFPSFPARLDFWNRGSRRGEETGGAKFSA